MTQRLHIAPDLEAASAAAAARISRLAQAAVRDHDAFYWVLTGGRTPQRLYAMLAQPPYVETIPWSKIQVYFSDERCVPPGHPDSNYRMASQPDHSRVVRSRMCQSWRTTSTACPASLKTRARPRPPMRKY